MSTYEKSIEAFNYCSKNRSSIESRKLSRNALRKELCQVLGANVSEHMVKEISRKAGINFPTKSGNNFLQASYQMRSRFTLLSAILRNVLNDNQLKIRENDLDVLKKILNDEDLPELQS